MIGLRMAFVVGAFLALGCGRTVLDDGFDPGGGAAATGGHGTGGSGQGGASGGTSGTMRLACGATTCQVGAQTCCSGFAGAGLLTQMCVAAGDPSACPNGATQSCVDRSVCSPSQLCCVSLNTLHSECVRAPDCAGTAVAVLCTKSSDCPAAFPTCCPGQPAGLCVPKGLPCPKL